MNKAGVQEMVDSSQRDNSIGDGGCISLMKWPAVVRPVASIDSDLCCPLPLNLCQHWQDKGTSFRFTLVSFTYLHSTARHSRVYHPHCYS